MSPSSAAMAEGFLVLLVRSKRTEPSGRSSDVGDGDRHAVRLLPPVQLRDGGRPPPGPLERLALEDEEPRVVVGDLEVLLQGQHHLGPIPAGHRRRPGVIPEEIDHGGPGRQSTCSARAFQWRTRPCFPDFPCATIAWENWESGPPAARGGPWTGR